MGADVRFLSQDSFNRALADPLLQAIVAAQEVLGGLETEQHKLAGRFEELQVRLSEGRFHLAVLGQFKRGKSTFLNALLGEEILPTSVIPLTAIPTFIFWESARRLRVVFADEKAPIELRPADNQQLAEFLQEYVTEAGNPKNQRNVSLVEVFLPSPILQKNVVLIDTPGIGSTFRHNTEATLNFLPQCDAALFLVSADPPVTEVEIEFLKEVKSKVARLFFLLNKVDYLDLAEQETVEKFLIDVLKTQGGFDGDIEVFRVSARRGLAARKSADQALWQGSGMQAVENHLIEFLASEKSGTLRNAISGKALALVVEAQMTLELRIKAMQMPVADLEHRLELFEKDLQEVEQERIVSHDLLKGANRRMHEFLEEYSAKLREKAELYLQSLIVNTIEKCDSAKMDEGSLSEAVALAIPGYFEHEVGVTSALFGEKMRTVLQPFQHRTNSLIEQIRKTAAQIFEIPYQAPEFEDAFKVVEKPYWVTHKWSSNLKSVTETIVDRFYSAEKRAKRIQDRIFAQVKSLVIQNVENIRWPVYQGMDQTFLHFDSELDDRLRDTLEATHGAIKATLVRRKTREAETDQSLKVFRAADEQLSRIREFLLS
ncbi:MAG TPA: Dynamin family protein [Candidatus Riflebacteria bacterium]|jgi:GTPase SAR1 family protein|nr:Dynamin family protein [Candidatus Riflebacteria bacterium]